MRSINLNQKSIFLIFVVSSLIITAPLISNIPTALPLGSEPVGTVPYFNLWTLGWNVNRLSVGYQNYWNAPIFYPVEGSFAFSDPQPLTGLLAFPFWSFTPAFAYNMTMLIFITLNGLAVYGYLRSQNFSASVAIFSGILIQASPFLTHERGVLQLQPIFGMIWVIGLLEKTIHQSRIKWGAFLGLSIAATFLTSEYYGMFLVILLPVLLLIYLVKLGVGKISLGTLILAISIAALIALPILVSQQNILSRYGFERSSRTIENNSAQLSDYLIPSKYINISKLYSQDHFGQHLFPGFLLITLGGIGLVLGLKNGDTRAYALFLLISGITFFILSLGLNLRFGDFYPYDLVRDHLPGFKNLRSPFRFSLWVQISLILLAAIAFQKLWENKRRLGVIVFLLTLIEIFPINQRFIKTPEEIRLQDDLSPAIFLPFVEGSNASDYQDTAAWMIQTLPYSISIANGYSGYFPPQNSFLKKEMLDFPTEENLSTLRELGIKTVIIDKAWLTKDQLMRLENFTAQGELEFVHEDQEHLLYSLIVNNH